MNYRYLREIFISIIFSLGLSTSVFSQINSSFSSASPESYGINSDALQNITKFVTEEIEKDQIVGAELLIIKNGNKVLHKAFGWNDREDSILMKVNTIFNIRSMTKTFTGAGIQILIDNRKLRLDDKAARYLPGFNNQKSKAISIEQLLTHRSGLPISIIKDFNDYKTLYKLANAIGETGSQIEPDTKFLYSDAGADVLGAIIEVVTNMPLNEFLNRSLFKPLKMHDTFPITKKTGLRSNRVASSYGGTSGNWTKFWKPVDEPFYPFTFGSQSFYSSPTDYAKFLVMVMEDGRFNERQLLSTNAIRRILKPVNEFMMPGMEVKYKTGFPNHKVYHGQMSMLFVNNDKKPQVFGYGGSDGTFAWVWPERDLMVLYFTQSRNFSKIYPFQEFERIVFKNLIDTTWEEKEQIIPNKYKQHVGYYIANHGDLKNLKFRILVQDDNLAIDIPGKGIFDFKDPDENGLWTLTISNLFSVQFKSNEAGKINEMLLYQGTPFIKRTEEGEEVYENGKYLKYLGTYYLVPLNKSIKVIAKDNKLAIQFSESEIIEINKPDENNRWYFKDNESKYIYFITDKTGKIESLNLVKIIKLNKEKVL